MVRCHQGLLIHHSDEGVKVSLQNLVAETEHQVIEDDDEGDEYGFVFELAGRFVKTWQNAGLNPQISLTGTQFKGPMEINSFFRHLAHDNAMIWPRQKAKLFKCSDRQLFQLTGNSAETIVVSTETDVCIKEVDGVQVVIFTDPAYFEALNEAAKADPAADESTDNGANGLEEGNNKQEPLEEENDNKPEPNDIATDFAVVTDFVQSFEGQVQVACVDQSDSGDGSLGSHLNEEPFRQTIPKKRKDDDNR